MVLLWVCKTKNRTTKDWNTLCCAQFRGSCIPTSMYGESTFFLSYWLASVSYVRDINKVSIIMDMIAAIEVQMITNFLPHQKRKFKSRTSEYFFKDMTHTQFKRTFRFSMEGVRYCQSEGQAELDFYSVLRAPAQHQPSRALSRKVSKIFWAVLSCFSALMNLIFQSLLNWGNCIKDHWP